LSLGQNLVSNPDFDTDLTAWNPLSGALQMWDPLDADSDPLSGSALVTNIDPDPNDGSGSAQCIDGLVGDWLYDVSAEFYIPSGQVETGHAYLLVQFYTGTGCSSFIGFADTDPVFSTTTDVWVARTRRVWAPAGTQSARLRLSVWKNEAGGSLDAHFDNVGFESAALVFIDGFESGDVSAWTWSTP
jgi:hypothetical protein